MFLWRFTLWAGAATKGPDLVCPPGNWWQKAQWPDLEAPKSAALLVFLISSYKLPSYRQVCNRGQEEELTGPQQQMCGIQNSPWVVFLPIEMIQDDVQNDILSHVCVTKGTHCLFQAQHRQNTVLCVLDNPKNISLEVNPTEANRSSSHIRRL